MLSRKRRQKRMVVAWIYTFAMVETVVGGGAAVGAFFASDSTSPWEAFLIANGLLAAVGLIVGMSALAGVVWDWARYG